MAEETKLLADKFTPSFLMDLCEGLTDVQAYDSLQPFIGKWLRFSGPLLYATPNPQFGTAGVTIDVSTEGNRRDAFLWFTRDLDRLATVSPGEEITVEGRIKAITSAVITLDHSGMTDARTVAILRVSAAADDLRKAAEGRLASGDAIELKPAQPERQSDPELPEDENPADRPNVDFKHLELWYAAFTSAYPNSSEKLALASARGAFPYHFVPRQWVRDLRGPQTMGRPLKNKEK